MQVEKLIVDYDTSIEKYKVALANCRKHATCLNWAPQSWQTSSVPKPCRSGLTFAEVAGSKGAALRSIEVWD